MRSMSGVKPYMRCTCNPDPDSFVRKLIDWWIDDEGYPIPERSGVLRWFVRRAGELHWSSTREALVQKFGEGADPISLTFIPAKLDDNPALTQADPGYRARLEALPEIDQARLLHANWNVRPMGGKYIMAEWFEKRWTELPPSLNVYMASDFAVTEPEYESHRPDYTEHGVFGVCPEDYLYVLDWWYGQTTADVWIDSLLDLWATHKPLCWFGEGGVIARAIEPALRKRINERGIYCRTEWVNPTGRTHGKSSSLEGFADRTKQAKAIRGRSFQARAAVKKIVMPANAPFLSHVLGNIVQFPAKAPDDSFDVLSLMCLAIDEAYPGVQILSQQPETRRQRWQTQPEAKDWRTA
jgi:hypothetical protein